MHHGGRTWREKLHPTSNWLSGSCLQLHALSSLGPYVHSLMATEGQKATLGSEFTGKSRLPPSQRSASVSVSADRAKNAGPWGEHLPSPQGALGFISRMA